MIILDILIKLNVLKRLFTLLSLIIFSILLFCTEGLIYESLFLFWLANATWCFYLSPKSTHWHHSRGHRGNDFQRSRCRNFKSIRIGRLRGGDFLLAIFHLSKPFLHVSATLNQSDMMTCYSKGTHTIFIKVFFFHPSYNPTKEANFLQSIVCHC